jgi:hypothetical protein
MNNFYLIQFCLLKLRMNPCKYISIVLHREVYDLLHSLDVLELNAIFLIDSANLGSRDSKLRKMSMKHCSSLFEREVSPVLQSLRINKVVNMSLLQLLPRACRKVHTLNSGCLGLKGEVSDSGRGKLN